MTNVMLPQPITRSADHRYTYEGETYPGVTTILRVLDKSDGLVPWAARQTAEAVLLINEEAPGAIDVLVNRVGRDGFIKAVTDRHRWQRDEAAQLGTEVHGLADLVVNGKPTPPMTEGIRTRVLAYADWWKASGWTLRLSEAMVVNTEWGFGGTFDLLAKDADGRTVCADIKTGKGVYREAVLQLTAYGAFSSTVVQFSDGKVYPMPHVDRYVVLHVTLDGVREIELAVGAKEMTAFLACLDLWHWAESMKGKRL